ncbi:Hypothetical predicted protein [Octopus vulgaris]|uniref:Uncharacterized protein n=1 Tax=Octopus vulgaris TaxID=6645 RepID=A0AA36EWA2_OCTVU|nr:Hypothetical predicted protein [Octopus vulgaris]
MRRDLSATEIVFKYAESAADRVVDEYRFSNNLLNSPLNPFNDISLKDSKLNIYLEKQIKRQGIRSAKNRVKKKLLYPSEKLKGGHDQEIAKNS